MPPTDNDIAELLSRPGSDAVLDGILDTADQVQIDAKQLLTEANWQAEWERQRREEAESEMKIGERWDGQ